MCFRKKKEDDLVVKTWLAYSNFLRAKSIHRRFCFILFICYIYIKRVDMAQWQVRMLATPKTWVRTPGLRYFHNIFPLMFTCRFNIDVHHTPSEINMPRPSQHQIKGYRLGNTLHSSQRTSMLAKKSKKAMLNGPEFHNNTSQLGPEPPLVCFLYIFLILFFIVILFSLFV